MKLKTKAKILLGALITSILIPYAGVFSPVHAVRDKKRSNIVLMYHHEAAGKCKRRSKKVPMHHRKATAVCKRAVENELYLAVQHNDIDSILACYAALGNVNTQELHPGRYTPLHYAVSLGRLDIIKCLILDCKAEVTLQNCDKLTPYELAIKLKDKHVIDCIKNACLKRCS